MAKIKLDLLDKAKPYGTHFPPLRGVNGVAHYEQNGRQYSQRGERIWLPNEPQPTKEELAKAAATAKAAEDEGDPEDFVRLRDGKERVGLAPSPFSPAARAIARQQRETDKAIVKETFDRMAASNPAAAARKAKALQKQQKQAIQSKVDVNLTAWAHGEIRILFHRVANAIKVLYGVMVTDADQAIDLLVKEGVADPSRVKVPRAPQRKPVQAAA